MKNLTLAISLSLFALAAHSTEKTPLFTIASDVASLPDSDIGNAKKTGATTAVKLKSKADKSNGKALFQISSEAKAPSDAAPEVAASDNKAQSAPEAASANALQTLAAGGKDAADKKAADKKAADVKKADKAQADVASKKDGNNALQALAQANNAQSKTNVAPDTAAPVSAPVSGNQDAAPVQTAANDVKISEDRSESALFKIASYYEADEMGDSDDAVRKIDFSKPQGQQLPSELAAISNSKAIQRAAPLASAKTKSSGKTRKGSYSYVVRGKRYQTLASSDDFVQEGSASWYGPGFHGKKTASGEIYDMHKMTAAHKRLPLGTKLEVTNKRTGKTVVVTVNDRGPFHGNRILDLSHAAASQLGVLKSGVADVTIRAIK